MGKKVGRHAVGIEDYTRCNMCRLTEFTKPNRVGGGDFKTKGIDQRHKECGLQLSVPSTEMLGERFFDGSNDLHLIRQLCVANHRDHNVYLLERLHQTLVIT